MKTTLLALASTTLAVAASFGIACGRSADASTAAATPAASSAETDKYTLELKPVGKYEKGKAATFEIVLKTKGEFHVNEEYPTKFKATESAGVKYDQPVLHKMKQADAFAMEACASGKDKCTLKITVKFTPEASGKLSLGGELQVGVCNKETCLVEKKQLDLSVPVT